MKQNNPLIYDLDRSDINGLIEKWGEKPYRTDQIWNGLYKELWGKPEEFSSLSKSMRETLANEIQFEVIKPMKKISSSDLNTEKILFRLGDDQAIETVLMRYQKRNTICISTQVGCAMGCVFCATGHMGFHRNLSSGEIIAQVIYFAAQLSRSNEKLTNIVVMGMGEPFHNYDATLHAIDRLNDHEGFNFGERRFTISTVGLIPMIRRFSQEKRQINLAISLHAADNELRSKLLPINNKYPLDEVILACHDYVEQTNRRITFEWALINSVNDTPEQAHLLVSKIKNLLCHVNLIPLNPTGFYPGQGSNLDRARNFKKILETSGIQCTIRLRRGIDIEAGCGQLMSEVLV
jgi:23S rRNA (adenine2503-C2)-methyltransferase